MDATNSTPSRSTKPDLDWSQIKETVLMLNVAVAQIRNSMSEGDDSVNTLTSSFMAMVERMVQTRNITASMEPSAARDQLEEIHSDMASKIDEAIVSFQFYDKLTQRLAHISASLAQLAELVGDGSRLFKPEEWQTLQNAIKSKYTVLADRRMFELILSGTTVEEALERTANLRQAPKKDDTEIELF